MTQNVVVYSEAPRNIPELITVAKSLGAAATAVVVGTADEAQTVAACGVEKVYRVEPVSGMPAEAYAEDVAAAMEAAGSKTLLVSMTPRGRAVAAMVAQKLGAPCASECKSLEVADGGYAIGRTIYGGKATSYEKADTEAFVATIPLRSYEPAQAEGDPSPVEDIASRAAGYAVKVVDTIVKEGDSVDVTTANSLVCVGRGLAEQKDMALAEDLAAAINGVVGCTRPISEDFHWLPTERYVGLSGKTVKPKLFIAVGVSGQIQCLAGASDSKVIVGINKDEKAPLFDYCDYSIVGDLYEIVPAITSAIKSL